MPKSDEFRRAMIEGWAEAKAAKAERRRQNRETWASSPNNSHNRHKEDAVLSSVGLDDDAAAGGSESLRRLRAIMADTSAQLYRRLDAAEVVLSYEIGPGAAVGADPETIAAASFKFLRAVADNPETPEALRFRALKAIVGIENARANVKSTAAEYSAKRELLINLANAEKLRAMRATGAWPPQNDDWAVKEIDWPAGWPGTWQWPPTSIAAMLEDREAGEALRARLSAAAEGVGFEPKRKDKGNQRS